MFTWSLLAARSSPLTAVNEVVVTEPKESIGCEADGADGEITVSTELVMRLVVAVVGEPCPTETHADTEV